MSFSGIFNEAEMLLGSSKIKTIGKKNHLIAVLDKRYTARIVLIRDQSDL